MDIETIRNWAATVSLIISACSVIYVWFKTPGEKVKASIDALEKSVTESLKAHDRRIQKVEDDMRHLPTKDDLHEVTKELAKVATEVSTQGRVLDRIDIYLRENDK